MYVEISKESEKKFQTIKIDIGNINFNTPQFANDQVIIAIVRDDPT